LDAGWNFSGGEKNNERSGNQVEMVGMVWNAGDGGVSLSVMCLVGFEVRRNDLMKGAYIRWLREA
jgi:hypothetical protein